MAKIRHTKNPSKPTAAGLETCRAILEGEFPKTAAIVANLEHLHLLENILTTTALLEYRNQLVKILATGSVLSPDAFEDMKSARVLTGKEAKAASYVERMPAVGTIDWVFARWPEAKEQFCRILNDAGEMEDMLRDLVANYNYIGLENGDIQALLNFVNTFCRMLRPLAEIQKERIQALNMVNRETSDSLFSLAAKAAA
ncbi:MAG: hypothetical protein AAGA31_21730 [Bacteroidota bacterium]